jgi:hypothetical protein
MQDIPARDVVLVALHAETIGNNIVSAAKNVDSD